MRLRNRIFTVIIACVFIGIGIAIIAYRAYTPIIEADQWQQNPTCDDMVTCANLPIAFYNLFGNNNNRIQQLEGTINFTSKDAFYVNNRIYYEMNVTTTDITFNNTTYKINQVYLILANQGEDVSKLKQKGMSLDYFLTLVGLNHYVVQFDRISSNQFHAKDSFKVPFPINMVASGVLVYQNGEFDVSQPTGVLIPVESQKIGSDVVQSHGIAIANKQILGLTWMAIALAPMVLGGDMILRVIFEGDTISLGIH